MLRKLKTKVLLGLMLAVLTPNLAGAQLLSYNPAAAKVKTKGEKVYLTISESKVPAKPSKDDGNKFAPLVGAALGAIPDVIDFGFKLVKDLIEKNVQKFAAEYTARNAYTGSPKKLPALRLTRDIQLLDDTLRNALTLEFEPVITEGFFVFDLTKATFNYSKAKIKKSYNSIDLTVEIEVAYLEGKERKTQKSSPISIQLLEVGKSKTFLNEYLSDNFPADKQILEVAVKVTETNPYKIKAEQIQKAYEKYEEDAKKLVQVFVGQIPSGKEEAK